MIVFGKMYGSMEIVVYICSKEIYSKYKHEEVFCFNGVCPFGIGDADRMCGLGREVDGQGDSVHRGV